MMTYLLEHTAIRFEMLSDYPDYFPEPTILCEIL